MATLTKYWPASKYRAAHPSYADDHARILAANVFPTPADCATLAEPIIQFLSQCTCYDMMGSSTQVVVIDVEAPLSVAFIAAQETRVQNCVLWSATQRQFVGVLSSTDYMKVLLYCDAHPQDADAVATWSIQQWRQTRDELESGGGFSAVKRPPASARRSSTSGSPVGTPSPLRGVAAATSAARPAGLITCRAETPLRECLQKMRDQHVRRIVTIADKEGESCSVVSLMDVEQIVEYLGVMFFHMEKAAASGRGGADASSNRASSPALEDQGSGLFASYGDILLPPHVNSILSNVETNDAGRSEPAVGPYHSIFDIPLKFLPKVGAHREQPISVSMEHPLRDALALMLQHNIESIAVCNAEQVIEDVLSRSDLLRMEDQGVYDTKLTVREALTSRASERLCVCYETDSLRDIFAHFVRWRIKELFLVHPTTGKLKGQINTSEIVFFIALGATSA